MLFRSFNPEKANQVGLNLSPAKLLIAHLYEEGDTTITPIPVNIAGILPPGYAVYNGMAYDISTQAVISGPHIVTFSVPSATDPAIFSRLRVLHGEDGVLVD